jgi:AAHS family 4-hydroxybenzoate transporter-like MFS transporter
VRLLALRGTEGARIATLLGRINPDLSWAAPPRFTVSERRAEGFPIAHLFAEARAPATLLLWVMFFMNLLDLYFLANWLPTVINNAGISVEKAVIATSLLQVGGIVGVVVLGRLIDRLRPYRVLAGAYFMAGVSIACIGAAGSSIALIMTAVAAAGFCIVGAQIGANALAAIFYPTFIRSTGIGWALGIGRIGSIIGPVVGGILLSQHWQTSSLFLVGAMPALIASAAALGMGWAGQGVQPRRSAAIHSEPAA